ncbi:hypothetical protein IU459_18450 [Nocardia amamiensis]|uniref:Uncharacterized protein n=1 Tax=Nocardia amamiensis TaxID=404578 RepID=A0ABS0CUP8_9NOCA|nr:hypothetical protein [Nocardia amamiensis]MBF6299507.1 hypothetical protein [Nocardia amamiensis]
MEREHEEAMRAEFARFTQLGEDMYQPGTTDAELDRITAQRRETDQRWGEGPHAEHWSYLTDAYEDWRQAPDTMFRFLDNIDHNSGDGVTDLQNRSLRQAGQLAGRDSEKVRDAARRYIDRATSQQSTPRAGRGQVERGR